MTKAGQAIINARIANQMYPYPIPPTVRTRTLGFDWQGGIVGQTSLAGDSSVLVPNGRWIQRAYGADSFVHIQILDGATWRSIWDGSGAWTECSVLSDGVHVRVHNASPGDAKVYAYEYVEKKSGRI